MIYLKMVINNPWYRPREDFESRTFFYRDGSFTDRKHWEVQVSRWEPERLAEIGVDLRWQGQDHAGPSIELEIFGFMLRAKMYDSRHWNHDTGRWYTEEEMRAENEEWTREQEKGA